MHSPLLSIDDLTVRFHTPEGLVHAVEGVDLKIDRSEAVGLVGESGCGKSVTALSILRLVPSPPGRIHRGRITFEGRDLLSLSEDRMRRVRGKEISMIFQEPMTALNPVLTVGQQVAEPLRAHLGVSGKEAVERAVTLLDRVRIPVPRQRLRDYPHQLSGGMRQRVMIAMALACGPKLLIADEPTTALDVTIQAQILALTLGLKEELGMALLLITHDLGVVAQSTNRVVVMYAGEIVEEADVKEIFDHPYHPYTQGLMRSMPRLGRFRSGNGRRLKEIPGVVPELTDLPPGCTFADRCDRVFQPCRHKHPDLFSVGERHRVRCWRKVYSG